MLRVPAAWLMKETAHPSEIQANCSYKLLLPE
jgi:hypothetical protein